LSRFSGASTSWNHKGLQQESFTFTHMIQLYKDKIVKKKNVKKEKKNEKDEDQVEGKGKKNKKRVRGR
jgi:hypothetical protein